MTRRKDGEPRAAVRLSGRRGRAGAPLSPSEPVAPSNAFDQWLNDGLHKLYDDVANEPIPEELLRLIEEDRKK